MPVVTKRQPDAVASDTIPLWTAPHPGDPFEIRGEYGVSVRRCGDVYFLRVDDTGEVIEVDQVAGIEEYVQDTVAAMLVEGTNITLTYDDGAGTLTIDAAGGGVTDHGALTGLSDDDHSQYSLANGTRWTTTPTASRAVVSDGSGNLVVSSVTSTELGYVSGVTSAIQTQLNAKAASSHNHAASDINSGTMATARLGSGTADNTTYLRGDSTWQTITISGDVVGPGLATDNAICRYDTTTGKLIQNSAATVDDDGTVYASLFRGTWTANNIATQIFETAYTGGGVASSHIIIKARRTDTTDAASGDVVGSLSFAFENTADYCEMVRLEAAVDAASTSDNYPGHLKVMTCPNDGSTAGAVEVSRFTSEGALLVGATVKPTANPSKVLVLGEKSAGTPPTMAADTGGFYVMNDGTRATPYATDEDENRVKLVDGASGTVVTHGSLTNGQLPIGSTSTGKYTWTTLTGTSNQITVTNGAGSITLSIPTNILLTSIDFSGTTQDTIDALYQGENANPNQWKIRKFRFSTGNAQANDATGQILFQNYYSAYISQASITVETDGTPGASDMPGRMIFAVTADGASSPTEAMRITENRSLLLGTTTKPTANAAGVLVLGDCGGNPTLGAGTAAMFSKEVSSTKELCVIDSAGNVTQISDHAHDGPAWLYDDDDPMPRVSREENVYLGIVRFTNRSRMERLAARMIAGDSLPEGQARECLHVESFADYNARNGTALAVLDWDTVQQATQDRTLAEHAAWESARDAALAAQAQYEADLLNPELDPESLTQPEPFTAPEPAIHTLTQPPAWLAERLAAQQET